MTAADRENGPTQVVRGLSIGAWNMDHWKRTSLQRKDAWRYLQTESKADVMLLQESVAPSDLPRNRFVHREIAGRRPWGSSVVAFANDLETEEIDAVRTRYGATRFSMLGSLPGSVIVARIHVPEVGPITCVSVYGAIEDLYAQTRMFRVIADMIPLFDSRDGRRVILGGDFNITDATCPDDTLELPRYRAILSAIESLGLVNLATTAADRPDPMPGCPCRADDCRHVRTFGGNPGTQLDWLYATEELARRCTRLRVDHTVMGALSDHSPLIAEFKVPPLDGGMVVDPDSFVHELGVRAGPECARIAEELIAWAHLKHAELDRWDRKVVSFDRLPTGDADPPEIWFQLDKGRPGRAENLLQWTFSIKADGRVVVQFLYMAAPFDTMNAREELWSDLCRIEGVTLKGPIGQPSFPLKNLARPENLEQFQQVFSKMVDTTLKRNADAD